MSVPATDESLLVPRISGVEVSAGSPMTSAGNWMSPPPPTTESTQPAMNAASTRAARTHTETPTADDEAALAREKDMPVTVL